MYVTTVFYLIQHKQLHKDTFSNNFLEQFYCPIKSTMICTKNKLKDLPNTNPILHLNSK